LNFLVTSLLYVAYNSNTASLMIRGKCGRFSFSSWFVCNKAVQIAKDLNAVREASKLFPLADVLPSSLESIRTIQLRRTDPDKESEAVGEIRSKSVSKIVEDSNLTPAGRPIRSRQAKSLKKDLHSEDSENLSNLQSRLAFDRPRTQQNNLIRERALNYEVEDEHATNVASNEQAQPQLNESSSAEFIMNARSHIYMN
jgi:hypothetical protein